MRFIFFFDLTDENGKCQSYLENDGSDVDNNCVLDPNNEYKCNPSCSYLYHYHAVDGICVLKDCSIRKVNMEIFKVGNMKKKNVKIERQILTSKLIHVLLIVFL
jgi:hypothetical protein